MLIADVEVMRQFEHMVRNKVQGLLSAEIGTTVERGATLAMLNLMW